MQFAKWLGIVLAAMLASRAVIVATSSMFSSPDQSAGQMLGFALFFGSIIVHIVVVGEATYALSRMQFEEKGNFWEAIAAGAAFCAIIGALYSFLFFQLGLPAAQFDSDAAIKGAISLGALGGLVAFFSCAIETDHWVSDFERIMAGFGKPVLALVILGCVAYYANSYLANQTVIWSTQSDCASAGIFDNLVMAARNVDPGIKWDVFIIPAQDICYLAFSTGSRANCERIGTESLRTKCLTSYVISGRAKMDTDVCTELPNMATCSAFVKADPSLCGLDDECKREVMISTGDYSACGLALRNSLMPVEYQNQRLDFTDREWCILQIAKTNSDLKGCTLLEPSKAAYCMGLAAKSNVKQCIPYPYCEPA